MRFLHSQGLGPCFLILAVTGLSACNWVDSTGRQSNSTPTTELNDGDILSGFEEEILSVDASADDDDGVVESYSWSDATDEGALALCDGEIDLTLAGESMAAVCEDADNCGLLFIADDESDGVFQVLFPKITAPVGVSHRLTIEDNDGGKTTLDVHFCIDSVNEEPVAEADNYSVTEGTELVVSAEEGVLANDSDDNDVRNTTFEVVGVQTSPAHASGFTLNPDGSFNYTLSPYTPFNVTTDSFVYQITDGEYYATAEVQLDLSVIDEAPVQVAIVPDQSGRIGQEFGPLDLNNYVNDPEGVTLDFTATGLPTGISLSDGVLSGTVTDSSLAGAHTISVTVSDGINTTALTPFMLTLEPNGVPQLDSALSDQEATVAMSTAFSVATAFSDPDGDTLSYSATGLPDGVAIGTKGAVGGTPAVGSEGSYEVTVTATDGIDSAEGTFTMTVAANEAPVTQTVPAQSASTGVPYALNVANYVTDPEGQTLSYSATGLPDTLTLSSTGLISGTPLLSDIQGVLLTVYNVVVSVSDPAENTVTLPITLTIVQN
ncbi:putative Ig domain-containing protein [Granulosicoccaceae sp. 1_MG-2023]|nr:putative Ig domain-containing protein [Granulosicoccaceae sp. 1_MG-2023]